MFILKFKMFMVELREITYTITCRVVFRREYSYNFLGSFQMELNLIEGQNFWSAY